MTIAGYEFRPRLVPTLAYVVVLALLLGLGFWQLERAEQKREALAARAAAARAPVLELNRAPASLAEHRYRRARASGRYDGEHQFLLDNQVRDGEAGYRVLTPLRLEGSTGAVLVDRGWVPVGPDRSQLPAIPAPDGARTVSGRIARGPVVALRLGEPAAENRSWPRRIQYLDFDYIAHALPYPVEGYLLRETPEGEGAVAARAPRDAWRFGPERHEGYAVQWFALAAALTLIWIGVNSHRQREDGKQT
ncbi:SURF1 family protein [Spiribacter halobius]|uniref:SURF1-like protein n=1 Tax=Sediminicurvatus halobius TaxID=2182432 RepID=A0A2U2MYS8_9GAMM|nr:SURF1 family protein [Spiribacter halobius]PWG61952.1 hypothetical protein DEM34_13900 [Spiribacter halobius]UEX78359.1 SURF1 family protein [Spiribacter halobius]